MTEVHPSETFYFDKYVSFELIFIWREFRDLRSQRGFLHLCGGMLILSAWGGGGLVWILPEQELPKVSLIR